MELHQEPSIRLNLGAGAMVVDGWLSVGLDDAHDIKTDLRALPLPDDHADEAMAIHVFEHFYRWEAEAVLLEWRRVLKPGAKLILELPELLRCCRNVLEGSAVRRSLWGLYGDPGYEDPLMVHRWCWSEEELKEVLRGAGFRRIKVMLPQWHGRKSLRDIRVECLK